MTCPTCGESVPEGGRFCSSCGHQLAAREDDQRRVVTVLFADLVGFTSMSEGTDPEQVKRVVDGCFEELVHIVESFGGRVDKIIGDAILALFGAPVGHEDDAERAVRAALRMQETLQAREASADLRLRIGVNTGEVLVGALRSGGDYTAMGDVVNTAQRLQAAARPGQVLVGAATNVAAGTGITYQELGPLRVRGRDERVAAWLALNTTAPPGRRRRRVDGPLVGRRSEMAVLSGEVDLAVRRRRAHVALLVGDAGVGKSRLAAEMVAHARERYDAWVLEGHCVPYGEANVWWPVAEALRQATGLAADATTVEARAAVTELVARLRQSPADDADVVRITDGIVQLLGFGSTLKDIDPMRAREEAMRALIELTEAAAAERPVVIVLSDLHWADQVVLDAIDQLAERLGRHPYVIIGTARHAIHDRWSPPQGRHNSTIFHVEPLDVESSESLLELLLGEQIDPDLRQDLIDRSGGNPFFIEELVALLDESNSGGTPPSSDDGHPAADLSVLPDSLRGLVVARLDALDEPERGALEDAAVLGRAGSLEALEIMGAVRRSADGIPRVVQNLVDKEVLRLDGDTWTFRSDLVRDVVYGTMTKSRRAASHAGIAQWIETNLARSDASDSVVDRIAHHYGTAAELTKDMDDVDDVPADVHERALRWIGDASCRALESEHHLAGAHLFGHALDLLGDVPSAHRWEALLGRSRCRVNLREIEGARDDAEAVLAEIEAAAVDDPVMTARALTALGDADQKAGHSERARATFTKAIGLLEGTDGDRARGEALRLRGMAELFADQFEAAETSITAAMAVARDVGDRQGEAWALQNLAWLAFETGRARDAEQWIEQSIAAFTEIGDTGGLGWALGLSAWVKHHLGDRDEAMRLAQRLLPETKARGDHWAEAMLHMLLASGNLWSGRVLQSLEPTEKAEELFARCDDHGGLRQAQITRGRALLMRGRVDEGWSLLTRASMSETGQRIGVDTDRTSSIGVTLGAVAIGDPVRARAAIADVDATSVDLDEIGGVDIVAGVALAHLQLGHVDRAAKTVGRAELASEPSPALGAVAALVAVADGEIAEAERLAAAVSASAKSTFLDRYAAQMAVGLAAAVEGDGEGAERHFAVAAQELEATDDRLDRAVLALAEAEAAVVLGDPDAGQRREAAEQLWRVIGVDPTGWRTAIAHCLEPATPG